MSYIISLQFLFQPMGEPKSGELSMRKETAPPVEVPGQYFYVIVHV